MKIDGKPQFDLAPIYGNKEYSRKQNETELDWIHRVQKEVMGYTDYGNNLADGTIEGECPECGSPAYNDLYDGCTSFAICCTWVSPGCATCGANGCTNEC